MNGPTTRVRADGNARRPAKSPRPRVRGPKIGGNGVALIRVTSGRILARKETHDELLLLLASQSEQPQRVTARNPLCLIGRELGEPSAIFLEDRVVTEPALVDPGIRAEQEPVGITCK